MITLQQLQSVKTGDSLCDMHDNFQVEDCITVKRAHIGVTLGNKLVDLAELESGRDYLNKMLWVIDRDNMGRITAVYVYDSLIAEVISFGF